MIRIDALWLCTQPLDMRAGAERLMAHVVHALGSARAHHGYLFANVRATRIKLLVHDGFGVWCRPKTQRRPLRVAEREQRCDAAVFDAGAVRCAGGGTGLGAPAGDECDHAAIGSEPRAR